VQAREFAAGGGHHGLEHGDCAVAAFTAGRDTLVAAVERDID